MPECARLSDSTPETLGRGTSGPRPAASATFWIAEWRADRSLLWVASTMFLIALLSRAFSSFSSRSVVACRTRNARWEILARSLRRWSSLVSSQLHAAENGAHTCSSAAASSILGGRSLPVLTRLWGRLMRRVTRPVQSVAGHQGRIRGPICGETDKIHLRSRNMSRLSHVWHLNRCGTLTLVG